MCAIFANKTTLQKERWILFLTTTVSMTYKFVIAIHPQFQQYIILFLHQATKTKEAQKNLSRCYKGKVAKKNSSCRETNNGLQEAQ